MTAFTDEDCGPAGIEEKLKRLVPHVKESQAKNYTAEQKKYIQQLLKQIHVRIEEKFADYRSAFRSID